MTLHERIEAFAKLGEKIIQAPDSQGLINFWNTLQSAHIHNPWFTPNFCENAIRSIATKWLNYSTMKRWISGYSEHYLDPKEPKRVGLVMAGNVPFVGFHDFLCVLISGHLFIGKTSSKDGGLMQAVVNLLIDIEPRFFEMISITEENLKDFDAVIATGSDNSARYFEYYFGKYPNIIRRNRHSIAILNGSETESDLEGLSTDIFTYFGLGCRNVSKIFVPKDYDLKSLIKSFEKLSELINHNKYANNYEYHRAIYIMNTVEHLDNGFILLKPDDGLGSPVGVLFYQYYSDLEEVIDFVNINKDSLQCIVCNENIVSNCIQFGKSQDPEIADYADGVDTIEFLGSI